MEQWEIQRGQGQCRACSQGFGPRQDFFAALYEDGENFVRRDYCLECWPEAEGQAFSFWRTRAPEPNQKRDMFVDDAVLVNFFERLADETELVRINFRFVLALILMRKRILKYENTSVEHDEEIWLMRRTGSTDTHRVRNPHLNEEQIQQVSEQLGAILRGEQ